MKGCPPLADLVDSLPAISNSPSKQYLVESQFGIYIQTKRYGYSRWGKPSNYDPLTEVRSPDAILQSRPFYLTLKLQGSCYLTH